MFIKQPTGHEHIIGKAGQLLTLEWDQSFKDSEEWQVVVKPLNPSTTKNTKQYILLHTRQPLYLPSQHQ